MFVLFIVLDLVSFGWRGFSFYNERFIIEYPPITKREKRLQQKRQSAQRCRDWLTDGYVRHLLNKQNVYEGFDRDVYSSNDPAVKNMIETKRSMIWLKRLVNDRKKWINHPAAKAFSESHKKDK